MEGCFPFFSLLLVMPLCDPYFLCRGSSNFFGSFENYSSNNRKLAKKKKVLIDFLSLSIKNTPLKS